MRITKRELLKIIKEEAEDLFGKSNSELKRAKEVDADDFADTLDHKINYIKALKIKEGKLKRSLRKVLEARRKIAESIVRSK